MIKKLLSLTLALCFAMSLLSFNVFAFEIEETEEAAFEEVLEEFEIELVYNEATGEFESITPFASEYFGGCDISTSVSGSKITWGYSVTCYGADKFTLNLAHQRSSNGGSSWSNYDTDSVSTTASGKTGYFSSDYSSSYTHRLYITAKAYVGSTVKETKYYYSSAR